MYAYIGVGVIGVIGWRGWNVFYEVMYKEE